MLTALHLGNFKAFADTQRLPIRPLTLIFGANSSGKSSLLHGLVLAHQGLTKGNLDVHRTDIGGESVDLGGFKQYVFRREDNRSVDWGLELDPRKLSGRLAEIFALSKAIKVGVTISLSFDREGITDDLLESDIDEEIHYIEEKKRFRQPLTELEEWLADALRRFRYRSLKMKDVFVKTPKVNTYQIEVDDSAFLRMSRRKGGVLRLDMLNSEHPVLKALLGAILEGCTTAHQITDDDYKVLESSISDFVSTISVDVAKLLPERIRGDHGEGFRSSDFLLAVSKGQRKDDLAAALGLFFPRVMDEIIGGLTAVVRDQFAGFRYLGPLRSYPPRHLAFSQYHDPNWQAGGGFAWEEIRTNPQLRERINQWLSDPTRLSTPYELVVQHLLTIDAVQKSYEKKVSEIEEAYVDDRFGHVDENGTFVHEDLFGEIYQIPSDLKALESDLSEVKELVLKDKRTDTLVTHRDVGIGISQVLPVLAVAYGSKNSVIAIEQPEIHLHPGLQAELGDVFIESALGESKNTFVIETHSEHLILRVMRRMRETHDKNLPANLPPVRPEDVAVLYVEVDGPKSIVREMPLNERGDLVKAWPGGFFEEGLREVLP